MPPCELVINVLYSFEEMHFSDATCTLMIYKTDVWMVHVLYEWSSMIKVVHSNICEYQRKNNFNGSVPVFMLCMT